MSQEAAKAFIEKIKTDKTYAQKISSCKNLETFDELVQGAGFAFTSAEFRDVVTHMTDEELSQVAGGQRHHHHHPGSASFDIALRTAQKLLK